MSRRPDPAQWIASASCVVVLLVVLLVSGCAAPQGRPTLTGRPRLLAFVSDDCPPCLQDKPVVNQIMYSGLVTVERIDATERPMYAQSFRVTALPTYVLIYDGRELYRTNQAELARRYIEGLYQ